MKKTLLTLFAAVASTCAMAQMHNAPMNFIGNSTFSASTVSQDNVKDTVIVADNNTSVTLPVMNYKAMGMTLPSIKFVDLTYEMSGSYMTGDLAFVWSKEYEDTLITLADGETQKHLTNVSLKVKYTHAIGRLEVDATFNYGSMPFAINYKQTGYYTVVPNEWNLVGRGTKANPYRIYDAADFYSMADNINATNVGTDQYFLVMADTIDFGGSADVPALLPSIGKKAITNVTTVAYGFNGNFEGNGVVIEGIYHNEAGNNDKGKFNSIFASVDVAGVIRNMEVSGNNYIKSYNYVAPIACLSKGLVENCINKADITATNFGASGIVGQFLKGKGIVRNCKNYGNMTAMTYAAGIVVGTQSGASVSSTADGYAGYIVEDCVNYGNMTTTNGVGSAGIVGTYSGIVRKCVNYGDCNDTNGTASSKQYTGGIASCISYHTELDSCVNYGNISGVNKTGGIVANFMKGDASDFTVTRCVNKGTVTGAKNVGGIVGFVMESHTGTITVDECENHGVVTCDDAETAGNLRGCDAIVMNNNCVIDSSLAKLYLDPQSEGEADAVEAVEAEAETAGKAVKVLRGGKLIIVKNGVEYNASGAQVK